MNRLQGRRVSHQFLTLEKVRTYLKIVLELDNCKFFYSIWDAYEVRTKFFKLRICVHF